jgi:hypothetical protein
MNGEASRYKLVNWFSDHRGEAPISPDEYRDILDGPTRKGTPYGRFRPMRRRVEPGPRGPTRNAVWIVTCADARVFWGVSADPDHDNDVHYWHPAESYGRAVSAIQGTIKSGGWPKLFIKR